MAKTLTKNQRILAIVTVSVLLAYAFVNLGLAINGFIKLKNNVDNLEDYAENWSSKTITDLQVVTGGCPSGYTSAYAGRSWPGTSSGCYCGSVSSATRQNNNVTCAPFCTGLCDATESRIGCKDVASKGSQAYNYISQIQENGVTKSAQVCVKKTDESLATNANIGSAGSCPSGYKACGSGDYTFCTKQSLCPIAQITSSSTTYNQGNKDACTSDIGCYKIKDSGSGDVTTISFKRLGEVISYPVSQLALNEYSMCKTEDELNKTPGRSLFYLLKERPNGCGTAGAAYWNTAFTTNENVLFTTNGIDISSFTNYPETARGLAGYYPSGETGTSYSYGLYNRGYIEWAPKCRNRLADLIKNIDKVSQTKTAQTALLVVGVLSAAALGIVLSIMELMNLAGKDLTCISGKDEEERTKLRRIKKIISYIFKGIQIPFQIWAIVICAAVKGYFADIAKDSCSTAEVNITMTYFSKTFQSTFQSNIVSIVITIASVLFDIFMNMRNKKEDAKVASNNPQPVSPGDEGTALNNMTQRKEIADQSNQFSPSPALNSSAFTPTPQPQAQPSNIHVNVQGGFQPVQPQPQFVQPQPQYVPEQQNPPQQYPNQFPPQQYAQPQYPPQQFPNQYPSQQQYPPQQFPNQYPPQQYPNQFPPQETVAQEPAKKDDFDPTQKFGRANYY